MLRELDTIKAAIDQLPISDDRADAAIDVEQIRMELQRSRPEKARIWGLIDRMNAVGGLGEKTAKLVPLLKDFLDQF